MKCLCMFSAPAFPAHRALGAMDDGGQGRCGGPETLEGKFDE